MEYPRGRSQFYAQKFHRLLGKACIAQEIGAVGCFFVSQVAAIEDAKRYSGPVSFHNGQISNILGISQWKTLEAIRKRCVDAGFLHYENRGKRRSGLYWTLVPEEYAEIPDGAVDENGDDYLPSIGKKEGNDTHKGKVIVPVKVSPSNPLPKPSPKEPVKAPKGFRVPGVFKSVFSETLRSNSELLAWFETARQKRNPVVSDSEIDLQFVFSAAEHALRVGKKPERLFAWTVGRRFMGNISEEDDEKARKRISEMRAGELRNHRTADLSEKNQDENRQRSLSDLEKWKKSKKK